MPPAVAAALLVPGAARASGFLTDQFGNDHGQPALANAYSVYFNPAAMGGMKGSDLVIDGVAAVHGETFDRQAPLSPSASNDGSDPTYVLANTGQAKLLNVLAAPFAGFVTDFGGSKLRLGIAAYIPFGGQVSWQKNTAWDGSTVAPGASDGSQRWASISAATSSIYDTAALAYRIEPAHLSLGVNVSLIRTTLADTRARNADGSDDLTSSGGSLKEGRTYIDVSAFQVGASAGVYWEAVPGTLPHPGASYTSAPNFGTMRHKGTFAFVRRDRNSPPRRATPTFSRRIRISSASGRPCGSRPKSSCASTAPGSAGAGSTTSAS